MQALPLYADGATASRRRTIDEAIARSRLQAHKVHDAHQRLIKIDNDERHHVTFETRQNNTATEHNDIRAHADKVIGKADGPQHQQQQPGQIQGNIIAATVAAMNTAKGGNSGLKTIIYHLKPKILGKDFTTSELRTWCGGMVFFWAAKAMETRDEEILWANLYDCMHSTQKNYFEPRMPRGIGICTRATSATPSQITGRHWRSCNGTTRQSGPFTQGASICSSKSRRRTCPSTNGTSTCTTSARTQRWTSSQAKTGFSFSTPGGWHSYVISRCPRNLHILRANITYMD
jgi:hypothetical protein